MMSETMDMALFVVGAGTIQLEPWSVGGCNVDDFDGDGWSMEDGDCDDRDETSYPGAPEVCDGADNDCNGVIDDVENPRTWYRDADGDGYGIDADTVRGCSTPTALSLEGR